MGPKYCHCMLPSPLCCIFTVYFEEVKFLLGISLFSRWWEFLPISTYLSILWDLKTKLINRSSTNMSLCPSVLYVMFCLFCPKKMLGRPLLGKVGGWDLVRYSQIKDQPRCYDRIVTIPMMVTIQLQPFLMYNTLRCTLRFAAFFFCLSLFLVLFCF